MATARVLRLQLTAQVSSKNPHSIVRRVGLNRKVYATVIFATRRRRLRAATRVVPSQPSLTPHSGLEVRPKHISLFGSLFEDTQATLVSTVGASGVFFVPLESQFEYLGLSQHYSILASPSSTYYS